MWDDLDLSDGVGAYFTGDPAGANLYDDVMDECVLYSPTAVMDFLAWNASSGDYVPGVAHDEAVAEGEWESTDFLDTLRVTASVGDKPRVVEQGASVGRAEASTDTNRVTDWDTDGGVDARTNSPGRVNQDDLNGIVVDGGAAPQEKPWTVMVYLAGDTNLERSLFGDLREMEEAGGSDDDVNVVAMFDGRKNLVGVTENNGVLVPDPQTRGGAWRFQVGSNSDQRLVRFVTHGGDNPFLGSSDPQTPPDPDMGDPATLSAFIAWTKNRYPAQKYALILSGHGNGWKGFGVDENPEAHGQPGNDWLYMGELAAALQGEDLELVAFDSCLMGTVEVAYQLRSVAEYFVASQNEVPGTGFPFTPILTRLKGNPSIDGAALGDILVEEYSVYYAPRYTKRTLSCVDSSALPGLADQISAVADQLRLAVDDFKEPQNEFDNVQLEIRDQLETVQRYGKRDRRKKNADGDPDFIDLFDFIEQLYDSPRIPDCYKSSMVELGVQIATAVREEVHGPGRPDSHGLSIYLPEFRWNQCDPDDRRSGWDFPLPSRVLDGSTGQAMYAPNPDCLPFMANDPESLLPLNAPWNAPLNAAPFFDFPADTLWDEFAYRYYRPVADAAIDSATAPDGRTIFPTYTDPDCGNPIMEIEVPVGSEVHFDGSGSSDADCEVRHYFWDFDAATVGCAVCVTPYQVAPGGDAADANDDMNADRDCTPTASDEKEADLVFPSKVFNAAGQFIVTLNTWDDNHLRSYHDTLPNADFVHPQSDSHTCIVRVVLGTIYCISTINSTGAAAEIRASGSPSVSAGDLTLTASNVPNGFGIFFHGANQVQVGFGNGYLCAAGGLRRGQVLSATGNQAAYVYDNSIRARDLSDFVGTDRNFQYWFRDTMGGGAFHNTSNAITISILP